MGTVVQVTTTLKDGTKLTRYRVAVTMADGRRVWRRARSKDEAKRVRRQLVEARELDLDPSRQTLADWLRFWIASLRDAKHQRLAPRTLEHYAMIVERHIIPGLDPQGKLPLTRVTERRIQAWLDASDGSARSLHHRRAVLRLALNRAVRQRLLAINPAAGKAIELPDASWHGAKPLTADESRRLLSASRDSRWHPLWRLAIVTGLRYGELMGLTWDDIEWGDADARKGTSTAVEGPSSAAPTRGDLHSVRPAIIVRAQLQRINGQWVRRATKAARSLERIAIDAETQAVLERHRQRMARERTPDWAYFGHVFVDEHGQPHDHKRVLTAFWQACDAAGIERRRFHDLRASSATLMRDLGVAEDTRMSRMGHSTTAMARHYAGASTEQDREAVERLAEVLG